jgi:hypothetical protein
MKTEGALGRRFSRHNEIYQSDVVIPSCKPGVGAASRWSAPWPSYRTRREVHALPIVLMSFDRLFLDRVARQQSPSPLHRQPQLKLSPCWTGTSFHRTATTPLTSCLSLGVHFTARRLPPLLPPRWTTPPHPRRQEPQRSVSLIRNRLADKHRTQAGQVPDTSRTSAGQRQDTSRTNGSFFEHTTDLSRRLRDGVF